VKRIDLIRHVESHGCRLLREGSNHSVYLNQSKRKVSTIPRHREIDDYLARKICRDLEIPRP
jgi:mRNA interferase HicA